MLKQLPEETLRRRREELARFAQAGEAEAGAEDGAFRSRFSLDRPEGALLYASLSDQALLDYLRDLARTLGRSPAQKEAHWVYRSYIRARFKNWPTALRLAGLSRSAGKGGKPLAQTLEEEREREVLLAQVREAAAALGRMPHPSDLPQVCEGLKRRYRTWGEVLLAAGAAAASLRTVQKIGDLEEEYRAMLERLRAQAVSLNRAPLRKELPPEIVSALVQRCGSWRNALYQVGLEPVRRISPFANTNLHPKPSRSRHRGTLYDCYYRLLSLDPQTRSDLELVRKTAGRLGHPPTRSEIPPEVRRRLQTVCGSWSNALFQLGLHPQKD